MLNLRVRKLAVLVAVFVGLFAMSCQEESEILEQPEVQNLEVKTEQDKLRANLAVALASSMQEVETRKLIKEKVIQQFDGDYDALYAFVQNARLSKNRLQEQLLQSAGLEKRKAVLSEELALSDEQIREMVQQMPLLNISVPALGNGLNADNWNVEQEAPLVAFITDDFDEATTKYVTAFDKDGNVYQLDAKNEPNRLVVVVGVNERVKAVKKSNASKMQYVEPCELEPYRLGVEDMKNTAAEQYVYLEPDCGGGGGGGYYGGGDTGGDTGGSTGGTSSCSSEFNTTYDAGYITRMKFSDLRAVESWTYGAPEIRIKMYAWNTATNAHVSIREALEEPPKDDDIMDRWWDHGDMRMFTKTELGNLYGVLYFVEEDGGSGYKLPVSLAYKGFTLSTTITIGSSDDYIGKEPFDTNYQMPYMGYIDLGIFEFDMCFRTY
jgi:hypothetical protein